MKYTEATRILENAGFKVDTSTAGLYFVKATNNHISIIVGNVDKTKSCIVGLDYKETSELESGRFILGDTLTKLAMTPLVERIESTPDIVDMFEDIDALVDDIDSVYSTTATNADDLIGSVMTLVSKLVSANEAMYDRLVELEKVDD